jgi:hypothetical protein
VVVNFCKLSKVSVGVKYFLRKYFLGVCTSLGIFWRVLVFVSAVTEHCFNVACWCINFLIKKFLSVTRCFSICSLIILFLGGLVGEQIWSMFVQSKSFLYIYLHFTLYHFFHLTMLQLPCLYFC